MQLISYLALGLLVNAKSHKCKDPICVVGAGISGLSAANKLKEKGYAVKVFEKTDRIGGKMNSFRQNGLVWNMGPIFVNANYKNTFDIINKNKIRTIPFDMNQLGGLDPNSGFTVPIPNFLYDPKIAEAFGRYKEIRKNLTIELGNLNVSPELFVSTAQWFKANNIEDLKTFALFFLTMEGYGSIDTTPAVYFVHLMDVAIDATIIYLVPDGMDQIPLAISKGLDVTLNVNIKNIKRSDSSSVLTFNDGKKDKAQNCQSVILAFPPVINDVLSIVPGLSAKEKSILGEVKTNKYATFASIAPELKYSGLGAVLPPTSPPFLGDGKPIVFINQTRGAYVSYHWTEGDYQVPPSDSDMANYKTKLTALFPKLQPGAQGKPAVHSKPWTYFPHVTTQSLQNGFYDKFDSIQGNQNLYYATPLLGFEIIESSIDNAEHVVEKFF